MKKLAVLMVFILSFFFVVPNTTFGNGDVIDLSLAKAAITGVTAIRLTGIKVQGWPGTYWADFAWDNQVMQFALKASGVDTPPTTSKSCGGAVTTAASSVNNSGSNAYALTLTPDPSKRIIHVVAQQTIEYPIACISSGDISQANHHFAVMYSGMGTLFLDGNWTGCDTLKPGDAMTGYIAVPEWFDFSQPYTIQFAGGYGENPSSFLCNP